MDDWQWGIFVSSFLLGGIVGGLSGGYFATTFGRKTSLRWNNILYIVGGLFLSIGSEVVWLCVGRVFVGLAAGIGTVIVPLYIAENAPVAKRGTLGSLNQLSIVFGVVMSQALGIPLSTPENWRLLFGLTLDVADFVLRRNPKGRVLDAKIALQKLRGTDDVDDELADVLSAAGNTFEDLETGSESFAYNGGDEEYNDEDENTEDGSSSTAVARTGQSTTRRAAGAQPASNVRPSVDQVTADERTSLISNTKAQQNQRRNGGGNGERAPTNWTVPSVMSTADLLFRAHHLRRSLIAAWGLQIVQQFSGINAAIFYSTTIFSQIYSSSIAIKLTLLIGVMNLFMTIGSSLLIERLGRRTLLLVAQGGMFLFSFAVPLSYYVLKLPPGAMVVELILFVASFGVGLGSIPWLILPELVPTYAVGPAASICTAINWTCCFLIALFFPVAVAYAGYYIFFFFSACLFVGIIFTFYILPETKGKTVEQVLSEYK
ncbi:hypothetical protein HK102_005734 [Quaeritorhiza haematococci]|nr:hypothetical protein HK102_005734 [Quaeritorhiza haematococci]